MTQWIGSIIDTIVQMPLWAIAIFYFMAGFIEMIAPPWPGTTILIFGGCLRGMGFDAGWIVIGLMFYLGESVGSVLLYELGLRGGGRILQWKLVRKLFTEEVEAKARGWFERYGSGMLYIAKFTAGINSPAILLAGVMHMNRAKAYLAVFIACLLHNGIYFAIGNVIGGSWEDVLVFVGHNNRVVFWLAVAAGAVYGAYRIIMYLLLRRKRKNGGKNDETEDRADGR